MLRSTSDSSRLDYWVVQTGPPGQHRANACPATPGIVDLRLDVAAAVDSSVLAGTDDPHRVGRCETVPRLAITPHRQIGVLMSLPACDVLQFLKDWWLEHIQGEDKKYVGYLGALRFWNNRQLCQ